MLSSLVLPKRIIISTVKCTGVFAHTEFVVALDALKELTALSEVHSEKTCTGARN